MVKSNLTEIDFTWNDVTFKMNITGSLTLLCGKSGSGKSFFFKSLLAYNRHCQHEPDSRKINNGKIILLDSYISTFCDLQNSIAGKQDYIICIDNGDYLFSVFPDLLDLILDNICNTYIIVSRSNHKLPVNPYARLESEYDKASKTLYFKTWGL